jgi:predicted outer membrane protein
MQQVTRRTVLALTAPALVALAGCQQTQSTARPGGDMNANDLDFVANAVNIINFDREECTLAETQSRSPEVRQIAGKLLSDANAFDGRLQPIVQASGIAPPAQLRTDLRVRLFHLRIQHGLDFDKQFLEDQIASHQEILNRQQMMMSTPGMNPQLTRLSQEGSQILERNLADLRRIQRQMMMMG